MLSMLTYGQRNDKQVVSIAIWATNMELSKITIEVHFVPLPPQECEEYTRHLHTLLLRAALRGAHQKHEEVECIGAAKVDQ